MQRNSTEIDICTLPFLCLSEMSDSINTVVLFVAGSSFAFSAVFYKLYQKKKEELIKLKASPFLIEYKFNINGCVTMCLFKCNLCR